MGQGTLYAIQFTWFDSFRSSNSLVRSFCTKRLLFATLHPLARALQWAHHSSSAELARLSDPVRRHIFVAPCPAGGLEPGFSGSAGKSRTLLDRGDASRS